MIGPREQELKLSFASQRDFEFALAAELLGERQSTHRLTNWYFDTPDGQLCGQRIMLRLRAAPGFILGLKVGREVRAGYFDSLEIEQEIAAPLAQEILAQPSRVHRINSEVVRELQRRCGVLPLVSVGELHTERTKKLCGDVLLEFDRIVFPDGSEAFELEVETADVAVVERWVQQALTSLGVEVQPQRRTKMERLIQWLEGRES